MTTPDPIALPELPEPYIKGEFGKSDLFTADQMRAYGQACVDALTPVPQVPADAVLRFLNHLEDVMDDHPEVAGWIDVGLWNAISTPMSESPAQPEQLASLEQRARELLNADEEFNAAERELNDETLTSEEKHAASWPRYYAAREKRADALRAITAALSMAADSSHGIEAPAGPAHSGEFPERIQAAHAGTAGHGQGERTAGDDGLATAAATLSVQPRDPSDSTKKLMAFYDVTTVEELIEQQCDHVEQLQAKVRQLRGPDRELHPRPPREG